MRGIEERYDLWRLVTFLPNKDVPIHRWFHFKEGFSRELVFTLAEEMGIGEGSIVLDPFVGSGTTPLSCMEMGVDAIGIDASPLAVLISYAKTRRYDAEKLSRLLGRIISAPFIRAGIEDLSPLTIKCFKRPILEEVLSLREHVRSIEDDEARAFFTLALMNSAMKCSYAYKDGSVVRIVKRHVPPLRPYFGRVARGMIDDVRRVALRSGPATIMLGDARRMERLGGGSVDFVITSPPYLNKIEYTSVYAVELDLFIESREPGMMRSYIGLSPRSVPLDVFPEMTLPDSARAYLSDMLQVLRELHRVVSPGGGLAIVVAGGVYPELIVETDLLLARLAEEAGFEVRRIRAVNRRVATASRTRKIGEARESILYLSRP